MFLKKQNSIFSASFVYILTCTYFAATRTTVMKINVIQVIEREKIGVRKAVPLSPTNLLSELKKDTNIIMLYSVTCNEVNLILKIYMNVYPYYFSNVIPLYEVHKYNYTKPRYCIRHTIGDFILQSFCLGARFVRVLVFRFACNTNRL